MASSKTFVLVSSLLLACGSTSSGNSNVGDSSGAGGTGGAAGATADAGFAACAVSLEGKVFVRAEEDLEAAAVRIKTKVGVACSNIAKAGGQTPKWDGTGTPTDDQVTDACNLAATVVVAVKVNAAGTVSLNVTGGECASDVSAQADCTASCSASGSCMADINVQCEPGKIEGTCSGVCAAMGSCNWDGSSPVDCSGGCDGSCNGTIQGGCDGSCTGTCMGTCSTKDAMGNCAGSCTGTCMGTCTKPAASATCMGKCSGSCKLASPVMCSGAAKCQGSCMGTFIGPLCKGKVAPPMCDASTSCKSSCEVSAQATAACTPPKVVVATQGTVDATVVAALAANLPDLILVATIEGKNLVSLIGDVTGSIKAAVQGSAACAPKLSAFVQASASVNVAFVASASVSGKVIN